MKRRVAGFLGSAVAIVALGVCGCGGGGMEEGVPKDLTPGAPIDANMPLGKPGSVKAPPQPKGETPASAPAAGTPK